MRPALDEFDVKMSGSGGADVAVNGELVESIMPPKLPVCCCAGAALGASTALDCKSATGEQYLVCDMLYVFYCQLDCCGWLAAAG